MMVRLSEYTSVYVDAMLVMMADFFGYHKSLLNLESNTIPDKETKETLNKWVAPEHSLYVILIQTVPVGFVHVGYRGGNVAWIEDILC